MVTVSEKPEEGPGDHLPPAYTDSVVEDTTSDPPRPILPPCASSAASCSTPIPPLSPSTNFLTIIRDHQAVKGGYTIDPSLPVPPGAVPSIGEDGKTQNMHVETTHGSINVVIELVHGGDVKGPARLKVDSCYGSATVAVHNRGQDRFHLKAASKYGAVLVRLPSTFIGTVSTWHKYGKLTFSTAVQTRLVTFAEKDNSGKHFIGDYASSGYEDEESWLGDHLCVESEYGRIKIEFVDEEARGEASSPSKRGFFSRLLG